MTPGRQENVIFPPDILATLISNDTETLLALTGGNVMYTTEMQTHYADIQFADDILRLTDAGILPNITTCLDKP